MFNAPEEIISRYLSGKATPAEMELLDRWLSEDEEHLRYFFRCRNLYDGYNPAFDPSTIDTEAALRKIAPRKPHRKITRWKSLTAAAMVIIGLSVAALLYSPASDTPLMPQPVSPETSLPAHSTSAVLILPSGEEMILDGSKARHITDNHTTVAHLEKNGLRYTTPDTGCHQLTYHTLRIPRGGEFFLTLNDGSRIWLNADSKIRFPVSFPEHERKIFIEGEAYLEVAHNAAAPFRVVMPCSEVTVLGTRFNLTTYPEETHSRITLAEGSIRVHTANNGQQTTLTPGEQAVIGNTDGQLSKRKVDPDLYCSWHEGRITFKNNSLEEILRRLARWYDIEIDWQNESLKKMTFSGELKKYDNIKKLLGMISRTQDVKFIVGEKKIQVTTP